MALSDCPNCWDTLCTCGCPMIEWPQAAEPCAGSMNPVEAEEALMMLQSLENESEAHYKADEILCKLLLYYGQQRAVTEFLQLDRGYYI